MLSFFCLSFICYGRFINNYFTSEDFSNLYEAVISPGYQSFFLPDINSVWFGTRYLPLLKSFYRFMFEQFALNPFGYRLLILLFHTINCFVVYLIAEKIFKQRILAYLLAVLQLTYSLHIMSVLWLSCANYVLMAFWFLLAFYCFLLYLEKVKSHYFFGCMVCWIIALLLNEAAYTLPLVCLSYALIFPPQSKHLRRLDNILFLCSPIVAVFTTMFYLQYAFSTSALTAGSRISALWHNPGIMMLKPFLGMVVMLFPEISRGNSLFILLQSAANLVDFHPYWAQGLFLAILSLGFLDRRILFGLCYYLITSFMLHFASFGSLNDYYLVAIGYLIFGLALLIKLTKTFIGNRQARLILAGLFTVTIISSNILVIQLRGQNWQEGGAVAKQVLVQIKKKHPELPNGSQIFFFNVPAVDQQRRINIFRYRTLDDAIKLIYRDPSITSYNIQTNKIYLNPRTIKLNGGYLYLPFNPLLDLTDNPQVLRMLNFLKRPTFIFSNSFPSSNKFYFRYQNNNISEIKIKNPMDFSRLFEVIDTIPGF